jgi:carbonic anhydrase
MSLENPSTAVLGIVCAGAVLAVACGRTDSAPAAATSAPAATPQATTRPSGPPAGAPAWHYEGSEGPVNWGKLAPAFAACGEGRSQSPIDIVKPSRGAAPEARLALPPAQLRIVHHEHLADGINNGHTIQINYAGADTLALGDAKYSLAQYHFHAPSEHTVDGKHVPMEMHLVHKAGDGKLAVVGVFIREGAHNKAFDPVWSNLPAQKGVETHYPMVTVDVDALLPSVRSSYRYDGSLTTPPCSEGVKWVVMTTPIELSREQIGAFTKLITGNNRPTQPLNGRPVITDAVAVSSSR